MIKFLAFLLGLIAASSDAGMKFVTWLVRVQKWIERHL
jgi:hypothetical protein